MASGKTYKVVSPFLGNNKIFTFNDVVSEKDFIPGDLENRVNSGHVVIVENVGKSKKKASQSK